MQRDATLFLPFFCTILPHHYLTTTRMARQISDYIKREIQHTIKSPTGKLDLDEIATTFDRSYESIRPIFNEILEHAGYTQAEYIKRQIDRS
jgi:hypothetical protein